MQKWELCTQIQWNNNKNESDSIWTGSREKLIFSGETVEMGKNRKLIIKILRFGWRRFWKNIDAIEKSDNRREDISISWSVLIKTFNCQNWTWMKWFF